MATEPVPRDGRARRLVGFSPERTLYFVSSPEGECRLVKVFEAGSMADAERELHAARALAGEGIVRAHASFAVDGKPAIELDWVPGEDLGSCIAGTGPIASLDAARIALDLARILERIARSAGWVHGDVKPGNVMLGHDGAVFLLDLEHAIRLDASMPRVTGFTGGTHGYAPPEASEGARPDTSFDVYGFGCTLIETLTGISARCERTPPGVLKRTLAVLPEPLGSLVEACIADDAGSRPTWDTVIARLESFVAEAGRPAETALDRARLAIAAGELDRAAKLLDAVDPDSSPNRWRALDDAMRRSRRMIARIDPSLGEAGVPGGLGELAAQARSLQSILRRFPAWREPREQANAVRLELSRRLPDVPAIAKRRAREGDFEGAREMLEAAASAMDATRRLGGLPVADPIADSVPAVLRDPERFLALAARDVQSERERYDSVIGRIQEAEGSLDPVEVQRIVDEIASVYGGASEITAGLKERLHRYEFALARIAGARPALVECARQLELARLGVDLTPTMAFVERAAEASAEPRSCHCRALLHGLEELGREHPRLDDASRDARRALRTALEALTDAAWGALSRAESLLEATPIPIRPLEADVNHIDRLDHKGCLIDRPDRSRTALIDALETVRVRVDRARATRDRLARGAQEALDQGHLTTALYDMERVVSQSDGEPARSASVPISDRYEQAKRLKHELETALRANHDLAARYRELASDPAAHAEARIDLLRERERALDFLTGNAGEPRRALYAADRAAVRFWLFRESGEAGRQRFEACDSEARRAHVAEQLADELALLVPAEGWDDDHLDRAEATITSWRHRAARRTRMRPSRRSRVLGIASTVLVVLAGTWGWSALARDRSLGELGAELESALSRDPGAATARLRAFVDLLEQTAPPSTAAAARELLASSESREPDAAWLDRLRASLRAFDRRIDESPEPAALVSFGRAAHASALRTAASALPQNLLASHLNATAHSRLAVPTAVAADLK